MQTEKIQINAETASHYLADTPYGKEFWCCNGVIVKNLAEFERALKKMSGKTFSCHVNKDKNDFSNWINDIIGDAVLAEELRKCKTKGTALSKTKFRVNNLKKIKK